MDSKSYNPEKEFMDTFRQLSIRSRPWEVWKDFITMFACALSNPLDKANFNGREVSYMQIICNKKYSPKELELFPKLAADTVMALEYNPEQDFLGKIFMSFNLGNETGGQFFTPYHVCQLMAATTLSDIVPQIKEKGYITINDPCCGAGATLIAAVHEARRQLGKAGLNFQNHILITAQDVDYTTALMCYIQLSLLGMAGYVKIGNTLTEPMSPTDTSENYWFTPMYFFNVWTMRRIFHGGKL